MKAIRFLKGFWSIDNTVEVLQQYQKILGKFYPELGCVTNHIDHWQIVTYQEGRLQYYGLVLECDITLWSDIDFSTVETYNPTEG